jgi:hypothetical protein
VVYDVIDAILDSNNYQGVPRPILDRYRRLEAGWVRRASGRRSMTRWPIIATPLAVSRPTDRPAQLPATLEPAA